jgi:hypothetical protein
MTVNLPFSKLVFVAGDPLFVPPHSNEQELELAREKVEHPQILGVHLSDRATIALCCRRLQME